jgi:hypothetical protein
MATIHDLCAKATVTAYLEAKGTSLIGSGRRRKCRCPLPNHPGDNTPSFYVTTEPDGTELFYCFGCNNGGNIISLIRMMEGKTNKQIVRELSQRHGMTLDKGQFMQPPAFGADVMKLFVDEDVLMMQVSDYVYSFLEANGGSEDAMLKAGRLYKMMDELSARGDGSALRKLFDRFRKANSQYKGVGRGPG